MKDKLAQLSKWNRVLAGLLIVEGIAIVLVSKASSLPVTTSFLTNDTLASNAAGHTVLVPATRHLFDINMVYLVAAILFVTAAARIIVTTIYQPGYEAGFKNHLNKARWIEYGVIFSLIMGTVALVSGIYDLSLLLAIFGLMAALSVFKYLFEHKNQGLKARQKPNWLMFIFGGLAGGLAWVIIAIYGIGASVYGSGHLAGYVYGIYATMLLLTIGFAANLYMQYKRQGRWSDYLYGEKVHMLLILIVESLLAWQIFFGILRP